LLPGAHHPPRRCHHLHALLPPTSPKASTTPITTP
jgi:hypothetical protein